MSAQLALPDLVRPSLALTADGAVAAVAPAFAGDSLRASVSSLVGRGFSPADPAERADRRRPTRLRHSWDGEPTATFACRFETVGEMLPTFTRASFNPFLDVITRNPDQFIAEPVPVGTVSKTYTLVQHGQAVDAVAGARLLAGWFRFICSNGLIVGTRTLDYRRAHTPSLELSDVEAALDRALAAADLERTRFERWQRVELPWSRVVRWVEQELSAQWGSVAAARVLHIARTGSDAVPLTRQWSGPSDTRPMAATMAVAGSAPPNNTVYRLSQILSWMAGQTGELSARIDRRAQVSGLTRRLAHACTRQIERVPGLAAL